MLSDPQQRLFLRLSVFAGGFALEEAEDVLDLLGALVERSLVVTRDEPDDAGMR